MVKGTCTKMKDKPIYNFVVRVKGDEIHIQADEYQAGSHEEAQLDFYIKNELIATFKCWDHVIQRDQVEMKAEVPVKIVDDLLAGFGRLKKPKK